MPHRFAELAFTPAVKAVQAARGVRGRNARLESAPVDAARFTDGERAFIEAADGLFMATVSETGWPYVQFRGGPAGFVRVLDETTFGFADFRGNLQYISVGNLAGDDRVALILMDHARRRRLKILARVRVVDAGADPDLIERLTVPGYRALPERAMLLTLEGFDWNCPQHITPRFTAAEIEAAVKPLHDRIAALEAENAELRKERGAATPTSASD